MSEDWRREAEAANERGAEECCGGCGHTTGATTSRLGARVAVVTVGSDSGGGGGGVKGWRAACGLPGVRGRDSRRFTPVGLGQLGQGWLVSCDLAGKLKAARPLGKVPERGLATQARREAAWQLRHAGWQTQVSGSAGSAGAAALPRRVSCVGCSWSAAARREIGGWQDG